MRTVFIGDVHGCIDEFQELAKRVGTSNTTVVCLGDFMDKGPDPVACVQFARESGFSSVVGNHEEKHIRWRANERRAASDPKYKNKMRPLPPEYLAHNQALTEEDIDWLAALPLTIQMVPGMIAVHGGLLPRLSLADQPPDKAVRLRYVKNGEYVPMSVDGENPVPEGAVHWSTAYDGPYSVVYGHEPHSLSTVRQYRTPRNTTCYGIDTGCVHGGHLTAMIVEDGNITFEQVKAKRLYYAPHWTIPA